MNTITMMTLLSWTMIWRATISEKKRKILPRQSLPSPRWYYDKNFSSEPGRGIFACRSADLLSETHTWKDACTDFNNLLELVADHTLACFWDRYTRDHAQLRVLKVARAGRDIQYATCKRGSSKCIYFLCAVFCFVGIYAHGRACQPRTCRNSCSSLGHLQEINVNIFKHIPTRVVFQGCLHGGHWPPSRSVDQRSPLIRGCRFGPGGCAGTRFHFNFVKFIYCLSFIICWVGTLQLQSITNVLYRH